MQALLDFLPVVAFAVSYWITKDFYTAILVIMVAVTVQVVVTYAFKRHVPKMVLISAGMVIVLGGISLLLKNDLIFKWKPTVLNWAFGLVFLGSQFIGKQPLVQRLIDSMAKDEFVLADKDWRNLNLMWVAFFLVSGTANIIVAYTFDEATWVNFKLFGLLGLTVVFFLLQALWISAKAIPVENTETTSGDNPPSDRENN